MHQLSRTQKLEVQAVPGQTTIVLPPDRGSAFYLVVPTNGAVEGSYGRRGDGSQRSPGAAACKVQIIGACD